MALHSLSAVKVLQLATDNKIANKNNENCSLSTVLTATRQKLQKNHN